MRKIPTSVLIMAVVVSALSVQPAGAFSMKGQRMESVSENSEINNKKFEKAALMEAKAYLCGTDSNASFEAMKAGMAETGLPEDIAVEVVSDLASGLIDKAVKSGSKEICGKPRVQISRL
jgi:hypothetical protein